MKTIVVTSTAKDAVGYAGKCTASVEAERERLRRLGIPAHVVHRYVAVDEATASDARGHGAFVERRDGLAIENARYIWDALDPAAIVCWLDGDDQLAPGALERVLSFHARSDVWATYGSFATDTRIVDWMYHQHFGRRYLGAPRLEQWRASHLRTFRAGLVQAVPSTYLEAGGAPVTHAIDCAVMWCILELVGQRYAVSTEINAIYSVTHSEEKKDPELCRQQEQAAVAWLRALSPLDPLERPNWHQTGGTNARGNGTQNGPAKRSAE
ncbi:MAG TPA: hypothetical protein VL131_05895 [Gammaproteobacteria bacterium]|nr:hypothetical protein [Gammaproteobacteria bacterium]